MMLLQRIICLLNFKNGKQNFNSKAAELETFSNNKSKSGIKMDISTGNNCKTKTIYKTLF